MKIVATLCALLWLAACARADDAPPRRETRAPAPTLTAAPSATLAPTNFPPPPPAPTEARAIVKPGKFARKINFAGAQRDYTIIVPKAYDGAAALPLLLALHGGGGSVETFLNQTGWAGVVEDKNLVGVFPQGIGVAGGTWNAAHCCGIAFSQKVDDVGFIRALIASLQAELAIDARRVYVTGYSNGAMMSHRLAAEASDIFAAMASYAGTMGGQAESNSPEVTIPAPKNPIPIMMVHGLEDENVKYAGGHGKNTIGTRVDISVARSIDFWATANGCSKSPQKAQEQNLARETYGNCKQNAAVALVSIRNLDHSYPNQRNASFDASRAMVEFLLGHSQ